MGVVFDEVVARLESPPQAADGETAPAGQLDREPSLQSETRRWRQQQATWLRRQQRLEAD